MAVILEELDPSGTAARGSVFPSRPEEAIAVVCRVEAAKAQSLASAYVCHAPPLRSSNR